jgi:hypothetical protein
LILFAALQLAQPDTVADGRPTAVVDSLGTHRAARRAQAEFESQRRRLLPLRYGGGGGRCDVRIGRFCYWHDEDAPPGPEEPAAIAPLRDRVTRRLDSAAVLLPGDALIAGQRVRYLVEAGRPVEAYRASEACEADRWWCAALAGLVLHTEGDHAGADSVFALALSLMPPDERCAWEDIGELLPSRTAGQFRKLSCEQRRGLSESIWWLADPLWSRPGNDRRTEHFARQVRARLEEDSRTPYQMAWADDMHELIVRFGWPDRWSREHGSSMDMNAIRIIGHEPHPSFDFFPDDAAISRPYQLSGGFDFRRRDARSRYAPPYARAMRGLETQVSRFFRGDSMIVVAAFLAPRGDTMFAAASSVGAVAIAASPAVDPVTNSRVQLANGRGVGMVRVAADSAVASVELTDPLRRGVARARVAVTAARTELGMLLYERPGPDDGTLEDVAPRAFGALQVGRHDRPGIYWEAAAPAGADSVTWVLTVFPRSAGWLTRLARTMRLAEAAAPVHLRFTEPAGAGQLLQRAVAVDLSHLPPGNYAVRLRLEANAETHGEVTRPLTIRR